MWREGYPSRWPTSAERRRGLGGAGPPLLTLVFLLAIIAVLIFVVGASLQ